MDSFDWPTMILLSPSQVQNLCKIHQQISTREERTATCAVFFLSLKKLLGGYHSGVLSDHRAKRICCPASIKFESTPRFILWPYRVLFRGGGTCECHVRRPAFLFVRKW